MMYNEVTEMWSTIAELGIATDEELGIVTAITGRNEHTLNMVVYVRTGYNSLEDYLNAEYEDEE